MCVCVRWMLFFSHPADFTPVCTTELGTLIKMLPEFKKRNAKVIAVSCDDVASHNAWSKVLFSKECISYSIDFLEQCRFK